MKIRGFDALTATLDLSPTDCLLLADALAEARWRDASPDPDYADALRSALEACAIVAATDTLRDNRTPEAGMLDDTRRVWGRSIPRGGGSRAWSSAWRNRQYAFPTTCLAGETISPFGSARPFERSKGRAFVSCACSSRARG